MKRKLLVLLILLAASGAAARLWFQDAGAKGPQYQLGEVKRGDLESTVSATGTLSALETVEVGTQVSGTISKVLVDFNDHVKKDQLLAVIDPELLDAAVLDARAEVERTQAQLDQARSQLERSKPLAAQGIISKNDLVTFETSVRTADAAVVSAQSSLTRALKNRQNAEIHSPIDGVVISRTAEVGQTVAASLQAPTLFIIARDLAHMEILASVDESDVGQIAVGQTVRFTVAAYPDRQFDGVTRQVRLQPQTVQNVVNYTVVVEAGNPQGVLLPGMTATVDFIVQKVQDALLVPTAALNIQPTDEMLETMRSQRAARGEGGKGSGGWGQGHRGSRDQAGGASAGGGAGRQDDEASSGGRAGRQGGEASAGAGRPDGGAPASGDDATPHWPGRGQQMPRDMKRLWTLDEAGALHMMSVKIGATDGFTTEVHPLRGQLEPGAKVVVAVLGKTADRKPATTSPFAPGGNRGGGGGRRFGF
jgi:HlyD family secretion protein